MLFFPIWLMACPEIAPKEDSREARKAFLRYFITINYNALANEFAYGGGDYLKSLYSEVSTYKTDLNTTSIRNNFDTIKDPFDFAMSITSKLH